MDSDAQRRTTIGESAGQVNPQHTQPSPGQPEAKPPAGIEIKTIAGSVHGSDHVGAIEEEPCGQDSGPSR